MFVILILSNDHMNVIFFAQSQVLQLLYTNQAQIIISSTE